mgnify:FL=1
MENYPSLDFDTKKFKFKGYNIDEDAASLEEIIDPSIKANKKGLKSRSGSEAGLSNRDMRNLSFGDQYVGSRGADKGVGCCAKFCMMLGLRRRPEQSDYTQFK